MAKYENIEFLSGGNTLLGRIYRPEGRTTKPAVAICHGFPGDTKNMDLAEELALNGIVTLVFYYQGAWGSGGNYSLTKLEVGAKDAVTYLRSLPYVDPKRVGLISHSMGALPLSKTLSRDPTIKTGVLMSPATDIRTMAAKDKLEGNAKKYAAMAEGKLKGATFESLLKDLERVAMTTNPIELAPKIIAPIMVVVGSKDTVTAPEACKRLFEAANEPKKWVLIEGADHGFSEHRIPLIRAVLEPSKTDPFLRLPSPAHGMPIHGGNLKSFLLRLPSLYFGLFLFAAGSVTNLYSGLGMSPWGVFHVGVSGLSGFTLGQVSQMVGLVVLLISWGLGFPPGFGTVMNMFFIGWFTDRIMEWSIVPKPTDPVGRVSLLLLSIVFVGLGSLFYMRVKLGAGPRDGLMVGLVKQLNKPIWLVRGSIEVSVLILGFFLGGPVGVGTVITALSLGYSVQYAFKFGKFDGKSHQMNLWELYGYLQNKD